MSLIHEILEADKHAPPKQRHTAKRILERLREEGLPWWPDRGPRRDSAVEATVGGSLHAAGTSSGARPRSTFGEATVLYRGQARKVAVFVMSLLYSDAVFCQIFPRECTETFQEGHRRAFEFFGGVPKRITYDNTKIARLEGDPEARRGVPPASSCDLESHYLFSHHFCLVRRGE